MNTFDIRAGFDNIQTRLLTELGATSLIGHPTAKGDIGELHWVKMLSSFLPNRYAVTSAFVCDVNGRLSDQVDVVIFDRHFSPLLFERDGVLVIPAESVYAVFEVKPDLTKAYIEYAGAKVESVRGLERTSAPITHAGGTFEPREPFRILGGILASESSWSPPFGTPFENSLCSLGDDAGLEVGCALSHGSFTYLDGKLEVYDVDQLMAFVLGLHRLLQGLGSVPALDLDRWAQAGLG